MAVVGGGGASTKDVKILSISGTNIEAACTIGILDTNEEFP